MWDWNRCNQFIKNGANYTGIDYSDESVKILKKE